MKYNKMHFAIDKTLKASIAKKTILRNYKNYYPKKSDVIVVIGGDGFMLETLKRYQKYNKPFYGINRGSFGFLMNKFRTKQLYQAINKAKQIGTYNISIKPYQDCCSHFVPIHPETKAKLNEILNISSQIELNKEYDILKIFNSGLNPSSEWLFHQDIYLKKKRS